MFLFNGCADCIGGTALLHSKENVIGDQQTYLILSYTTWKHSSNESRSKTILKLLCKLEHIIKPREIVAEIEYSNGMHNLVLKSSQIKYQAY